MKTKQGYWPYALTLIIVLVIGIAFEGRNELCAEVTYMKTLRDIQWKNHVPVQRPLRLFNTSDGWIIQDGDNFLQLGRVATELTDTCILNVIHEYLINQ